MKTTLIATTFIMTVILTGCSTFKPAEKTPPQLAKANYICDATGLAALIGEQANANTGAVALRKSYAKTLLWIAPGTAVTKDYRRDRLNISYNQNMLIEQVNCG